MNKQKEQLEGGGLKEANRKDNAERVKRLFIKETTEMFMAENGFDFKTANETAEKLADIYMDIEENPYFKYETTLLGIPIKVRRV